MTVSRRSFAFAMVALVGFGAGCSTCRSTEGAPPLDASVDTGAEATAAADAGELPARCKGTTAEAEVPGGDTFEPGAAIVSADRLVVAGSYVADATRKGIVLSSDLALAKVDKIELGDLGGGDLAPLLATCTGCTPVVAAYAPSGAGKSLGVKGGVAKEAPQRVLLVSSLEANRASLLFKVPQQGDESAAFDLLLATKDTGLVAWDEDSDRVVRGVVKVASFAQGKLGEAVVATPYETDADTPKLVRTEKGDTFVVFLARESFGGDGGVVLADADKAGAYLEAPGEDRAHQWVEAVALEPNGRPRGAPFAVTPRGKGFAASFELVAAGEGFDVLVVDGAVERDGAGSKLVRVPVRSGKPGTSAMLATGVAGAAAVFGKLVTFVDPSERTMLVPLDPPHAVSREPLAAGGRFVAEVAGGLVSAQIVGADGGPARAFLKRHSCP